MIYPIRPSLNIDRIMYTWSDANGGSINALTIPTYFIYVFFFVGDKLGLPLVLIQQLFLYFNFVLPGLGMYYLTSVIFRKVNLRDDGKRAASWVAALFYMLSPTLLSFPQVWWYYGVFPFIVAFFIKTVDATRLRQKLEFSLLAALFAFGLLAFFPGYQPEVDLALALILYAVGYALTTRQIRNLFTSLSMFILVVFLINLGVTFDAMQTLFFQGGQLLETFPLTFTGAWLGEAPNALMHNLSLTFGLDYSEGQRFPPTGFYYLPGVWVYFVNFLLIATAFAALLLKRSKAVLYFAVVALFGLVIANGPNPPFGDGYKWLLQNFVVFRGFRSTGESTVLIALGYSVLLGIAVSEACWKAAGRIGSRLGVRLAGRTFNFKNAAKVGATTAVILLVLINGWPFATGAYFNTPGQWPNNVSHDIPTSYYAADQWVAGQDSSQDFRVLSLPLEQSYQSANWPSGPYFGVPIMPFISSKPLIFDIAGRNGFISPLVNLTYSVSTTNPDQMARLAGLLNVKYFIVDGYSDKNLASSYNQTAGDDFRLGETFDKLEVFSLNQGIVFPRVYASSNLRLVDGQVGPQLALMLNGTENSPASKPALILSSQTSKEMWQFLQNIKLDQNAHATFTQANPTKYIVHVTSAGPTVVVLSTQYDDYWTADVGGTQAERHFIANGYANAWYVAKSGSFDMTLDYKAQDYFYLALSLSAFTLVACVLLIWTDFLRLGTIMNKLKASGGRSVGKASLREWSQLGGWSRGPS